MKIRLIRGTRAELREVTYVCLFVSQRHVVIY